MKETHFTSCFCIVFIVISFCNQGDLGDIWGNNLMIYESLQSENDREKLQKLHVPISNVTAIGEHINVLWNHHYGTYARDKISQKEMFALLLFFTVLC